MMGHALAQFVQQTHNAREYKRAVAVQMVEHDIAHLLIMHALQVSASQDTTGSFSMGAFPSKHLYSPTRG